MPPLLSLPIELLTSIIEHIVGRSPELDTSKRMRAIKNLRLTCNYLAKFARPATFETVRLYPDELSVIRLRKLQTHPELSLLVRTVVLNTFFEDEYGYNDGEWFGSDWRRTILSIGKFPNLASVHVVFYHEISIRYQDINFRTDVLLATFAALNKSEYPTPNLRALTIKNLQSENSSRILKSPHFRTVLARLTELHLSVAAEGRWNRVRVLELQKFFGQLPSLWLEPTQNRLTHLTLYVSTYWGWLPRFDPRELHFPNLRYLALGNYTITHDWQIDWILSHKSSLETLILDDCPICFCIHPSSSLYDCIAIVSHDDHTKLMENERNSDADSADCDDSIWLFDQRWHNYFPKFETGLPHLTKFVYGYGNLNFYKRFKHYEEYAFELRDFLLPSLKPSRYIIFNGSFGSPTPQWIEPDVDHQIDPPDAAFSFSDRDGKYGKVVVRSPALIEPVYFCTERVHIEEDEDFPDYEDEYSRLYPVKEGLGCQNKDEENFKKLLDTVRRRAHEKDVA